MTKLTIRYFYGKDESRTLYTLTLLQSKENFLSSAFKDSIECVVFLQTAGADILDIDIFINTSDF